MNDDTFARYLLPYEPLFKPFPQEYYMVPDTTVYIVGVPGRASSKQTGIGAAMDKAREMARIYNDEVFIAKAVKSVTKYVAPPTPEFTEKAY